jgi:hypothetical protein
MLTLNQTKYLSDFDQTMSYEQTIAVFGMIPVGEYCFMLGIEQHRKAKGMTKDEVLTTIYTYSEGVNRPAQVLTPTLSGIVDLPCCGGGKVR